MTSVAYRYDVPSTSYFTQITSANTTDTQTATPPADGARGFFIHLGTTSCYMTLDGSTPSSSNGLLVTKDQLPWFVPIGSSTIKIRSSAAANAVASIQWVR